MPTLNPRITITLTPRVHAALNRFSELTGKSKSSMVGEILEESIPMFLKLIKVIEAAKLANDSIAAKIVAPFNKAQAQVESQLGLAWDSMDGITDDLLHDVEQITRRSGRTGAVRRAKPPAGDRPALPSPISNRGGRTLPDRAIKRRKPLTRKAKG